MKIKGSFDLIAYIPTASTLERSRGLSSVAVAETALIDARAILANNSRHPWASPSQKEAAKNNFICKRKEYLTAIVEHNERCKKKNLTHYLFTPKQSLLHDPSELALERMNYGVRHPTSKGGIPFMHRVDQPFDPKAISGKDLWLDEAVAWATQDAYYAHKDMIEIRLKEGKPLEQEEVKQIISARDEKLYKDFYITPDTQMMAASRIELMNMMLENTEYLLFISLSQSMAPGFVSLEAKNINEAFQKNDGLVESKLTKKIPDFAKLKSALVNLDPSFSTMKFDNNSQVILNKLLEILGRSGPDERKVMEFVSQIVPAAQHKEFSNLIRSLHNLYKSREQMNLQIDKINHDLANQTGKAGEAQRAVNRENGAKLWNKRTKKLPQGSEKVAYGVVAAARTAELLLDENFDPNHADALKGKISEPVQEALGSGADPKFAEAAEQGAIDGVKYAKSHAADLDIIVGLSSVAVFNSINSTSQNFKVNEFSNDEYKTKFETNLQTISLPEKYRTDAVNYVSKIIVDNIGEIKRKDIQPLVVNTAPALSVYLTLRHSNIADDKAKKIATAVMNHPFTSQGKLEKEDIKNIPDVPSDLVPKIYNSARSSLAIANGLIEVSADVKAELTGIQAAFKVFFKGDLEVFGATIAKKVYEKIRNKSIDVTELGDHIEAYAIRLNQDINNICNLTPKDLELSDDIDIDKFNECLIAIAQECRKSLKLNQDVMLRIFEDKIKTVKARGISQKIVRLVKKNKLVFNNSIPSDKRPLIKMEKHDYERLAKNIYAGISTKKGTKVAADILGVKSEVLGKIKDIIEKNPTDQKKVIQEISSLFSKEEELSTYTALAFVLGNNINSVNIEETIRSEAMRFQPRLIMATSAAIGSAVANMVPGQDLKLANRAKNYFLNNHDQPFNLKALWSEISELKPILDDKIQEEVFLRVYDAYVLATATKAMKEAETTFSQEFKDAKAEEKRPRYREVAAAVTAAALAGGCTQTQALELSKELTVHYLQHGNFNALKNYKEIVDKLSAPKPANSDELVRLLSRAAPVAVSLTKEDDPMRAGTVLAAEVFKFMTPAYASSMAASVTMAASVAKTRKVDASAMTNSAIYAAGMCKKLDLSPATGAVLALTAKDFNFEDFTQPEGKRFKNRMKNAIFIIESGAQWMHLTEGAAKDKAKNIANKMLTAANNLYNTLHNKLHQDMFSEGLAIIANTMAIGEKLGLSPDEAQTLASHLAHKSNFKSNLTRSANGGTDHSALIVTTNVALASQCVNACLNQLNPNDDQKTLPEINYDDYPNPVTEDMVARKAREAYYQAKKARGYPNDNAKRVIAEILGRKAAMSVYLDALQNRQFASVAAFRAIAVLAINDSEKAIQALEEYRNSMPSGETISLPSKVDPKLVKKIVNSNIMAILVQQGVKAGEGTNKIEDQVLGAINKIIERAFLSAINEHQKEKIKEIINSKKVSPMRKGVLISELIKPVSREVSEAIATVTTYFAGKDPSFTKTLRGLAKAGAIARVRDEGVLPSMSEHEPNKIPKMLAEIAPDELLRLHKQKMEHFKELAKERNSITGDFMGVSEEVSKIQYCTINTKDVSTWSFHFDGDEPNEHHGLEDLSDFKDLIPQLQDLDGHLTVAHFEKAIENFNKNHRNEHKIMNFLRTSVGMKLLPPTDLISKDALTHRKDGSLKLSTKGLSRGQLKEIFKEVIQLAKEDKTYKTAKMAGKDTVMKIPASNIMA